jgi:S1-C subfamily serine protease
VPSRQQRASRRRPLTALAVACFLVLSAIVGYSIGSDRDTATSNASNGSITQQIPSFPSNGSSGSSNSGGSRGGQQANIDVQAIAQKVSPSVVNLMSTVDGGQAAGTGIVISSNGLVLTNNHVIARSTNLQAEIGGNGTTKPVKVLGYDIEHDVALVQIENGSGLTAASLGNSSSVQVGDAIVALGNAGGKGGTPTVVSGTVTALDQQITAADSDGSNAETLSDLVQIDANIQPGDSGGPLVDANGNVVGMNAAASSGNGGGFGFGRSAANEGYAIPIEDAIAIARKIQAGSGTDTIHVGGHAAILGIAVSDRGAGNGSSPFGNGGSSPFGNGGSGRGSSAGNGAYVEDVQSGSGADKAGIEQGSTVTSVDGKTVSSATELTHAMVKYQPGDSVKVTWTDSSGQSHTATVTLGSGPPA